MKNDSVYIQHILDAVELIDEFLCDVSKETFFENKLINSAVIRQLEIIGEAAGNISDGTYEKYNKIPWSQIIGMRNQLIHGYFGVDLDIVWNTCKSDLLFLKESLYKR